MRSGSRRAGLSARSSSPRLDRTAVEPGRSAWMLNDAVDLCHGVRVRARRRRASLCGRAGRPAPNRSSAITCQTVSDEGDAMTVLDQVRELEREVIDRLKELEPLIREYEELRE